MPELPEVETTMNGIKPHVEQQMIKEVIVRQYSLRWDIPRQIHHLLKNNTITALQRRAKYILLYMTEGCLIIHLGMSGRLRVLTKNMPANKHDHVDILFANHKILRFTDPRRFGAILWAPHDPHDHPLLKNLGVEPLTRHFTADYLWSKTQGRSIPIKTLIMDNKIVTGIGNIYATEALFIAGIYPATPAKLVSIKQIDKLVVAIKKILKQAIKQGGTTLKDFVNSDGKPGYFSTKLKVYGRDGKSCVTCAVTLTLMRINQRSTVYCQHCQPFADI